MKVLVLSITLLLQGCFGLVIGVAQELEKQRYNEYVQQATANNDHIMTLREWQDWTNPRCEDEFCDRTKLKNRTYGE